jgi:MFS family permease
LKKRIDRRSLTGLRSPLNLAGNHRVSSADPTSTAASFSPRVRRWALPVTTFVQAASSAGVIGPTVAAPPLLERLQLGPGAVGMFVAVVYLGAMIATQIGAFVVRRHGPIRASQVALLASTAGLMLMAVPSLPLVTLGALLIGLGYGPITPASSQMLARTTDPRHFAVVFSIKQTGVPLGGVIAGLIVPPLPRCAPPRLSALPRSLASSIANAIARHAGRHRRRYWSPRAS